MGRASGGRIFEEGDDPELIRRRERERIRSELLTRFQAMREDGDDDMRTVIQHVREVTGTPG